MKKIMLVAACVASSVFAETVVQWTQGATSLADGAVTASYDAGGQLTNLTASLSSCGAVTVSGTGTVSFAAGAELVANDGSLRFEVPVESAGDLSLSTYSGGFDYSNFSDYLPQNEADACVIARQRNLEDYDVVIGYYKRFNTNFNYGSSPSTIATPCHVVRSAGSLSYQMQAQEGGWIKCVFLELRQVGADIVAWTPRACYVPDSDFQIGADFRVISSSNMGVSSVANGVWGYGLDFVGFSAISTMGDILFTKALTVGGKLSVGAGLNVVAEGPDALVADAEWDVPLYIEGSLTLHDVSITRLSGATEYGIGGSMTILADAEHPVAGNEVESLADYPGKDWETVIYGRALSSITNLTALAAGGWFGEGWSLGTYMFSNNGSSLSCQFQLSDAKYIKGIVYEMRQAGHDIEARVVKGGYYEYPSGADPLDYLGKVDLLTKSDMDVITGPGQNGYGLKQLKVAFDTSSLSYVRSIELNNAVTYNGSGDLYLRGSDDERLIAKCVKSAALNLSFHIENNAVIDYNAEQGVIGTRALKYSVSEGGEFWHNFDWTVSPDVCFCLTGGVFRVFNNSPYSDYVANVYICYIDFADGGTLAKRAVNTGYYNNSLFRVYGTKPAYIEKGFGVVGHPDVEVRTVTFDVADVTGDDSADLYLDGVLYYNRELWANAQLIKSGDGTLRITARNSVTNFPLRVTGGTWLLAAPNCTDPTMNFSLEGGTLGTEAACSNALNGLSLADMSDNALQIAADTELSFTSLTVGHDATLEVSIEDSTSRLRIGTSRCLTAAECRAIRFNGGICHQDDNGYIVGGALGTAVIVR